MAGGEEWILVWTIVARESRQSRNPSYDMYVWFTLCMYFHAYFLSSARVVDEVYYITL